MENRFRTPFNLTLDSCKGLEFDIVIIPYFEKANWALGNQRQERNDGGNWINIFNADGTPKMWATPNHYYVGATRARRQLYILYDNRPTILCFQDEPQQDLFEDNLPF
jgi:superfamily I DNA/RNA helicase